MTMPNNYFHFKQFTVIQESCAMKVSTDSCLFGAWIVEQLDDPKHILDIGAGTGLLSLMCAQHSQAHIDAIEIERCCFQQLSANLASSSWKDRLTAVEGDILNFKPEKAYQTIISNPPFYEKQLESPDSAKNLARHGSTLNLESLLTKGKSILEEKGDFYLLMPYYRLEACIDAALMIGFNANKIATVRHSPNHLPFRVMIKFCNYSAPTQTEIIDIYSNENVYGTRFVGLLSSFYQQL
jgi:tRNA1Val (adenine37-N6)-methyltransferase